jgi:hypothetical protein
MAEKVPSDTARKVESNQGPAVTERTEIHRTAEPANGGARRREQQATAGAVSATAGAVGTAAAAAGLAIGNVPLLVVGGAVSLGAIASHLASNYSAQQIQKEDD